MPGGKVCSVAVCKNNSKNAKETDLIFFTFPRDGKIRDEWMKKCYRKDKWNADNKRICSKHFKLEDFEDLLQARLMNLRPKKLKKDAIPSLFLLSAEKEIPKLTKRSEKMIQKESKSLVDNLKNTSSKSIDSSRKDINTVNIDISIITSTSKESDLEILKRRFLKRRFAALKNENVNLQQKISEYESSEKNLKLRILQLDDKIKKIIVSSRKK